MCTGVELVGLLGAGLGTAGQLITASEQQKNAERMAAARNEKLSVAMKKNDALADQSRAEFNARQQKATAENIEQERADKTAQREEQLVNAAESTPAPTENISLAGSAPTVVKSELAKRMSAAMSDATDAAKAQAKLGGYGDAWLGQGFQDVEAGRNIAKDANFAAGNFAILPYQQDIAEQRAYKPISPIGGLLSGFGSMMASYGGSGGAVPKKSYTSNAWLPN